MNDMDNVLLTCYGGSIAYGTNTPESDVDIRGIFCADEEVIRTPFHTIREVTLEDHEDGKLYELNNFMKLYVDMNPNILELLWVDDKSIITSSESYEHLRSYRDQLLSTKAAFTFTGYAMQQMKRIKGHNKWINNPQPVEAPLRKDFIKLIYNYTQDKLIKGFDINDYQNGHMFINFGSDIMAIIENKGGKLFNKNGSIKVCSNSEIDNSLQKKYPKFIIKVCEAEYKQAKKTWKDYWTWKRERNPIRHQLEVDYGFDTKHAGHIVRLMRMGEEILSEGKVKVMRPDVEELLSIRNGSWSYDELLEWAEEKDNLVRNVLYKSSHLPKTVDLNLASKVLMETQDMYWNK